MVAPSLRPLLSPLFQGGYAPGMTSPMGQTMTPYAPLATGFTGQIGYGAPYSPYAVPPPYACRILLQPIRSTAFLRRSWRRSRETYG